MLGGAYFFTVNTYRRQTFLTDVDVRSALREAIATLRLTHPLVIEALLPDHRHPLSLEPGEAWVRGTGEALAVFGLP
jgi:putative transposase